MYECLGMHDDWQFVDPTSQRQTKHWNIGNVMARARTYTCKSSFSGMQSFEDTSRPSLKAGSCKIVEEDKLNGIAACWNSHVNASDIASVVNAFACLFFHFILFIFSFIIPFLPGSPFRVFDPPGNSFFTCPCFCLNCL